MSRASKYSAKMKADLVLEYLSSSESQAKFSQAHNIPYGTFATWVEKWQVHGVAGFIPKKFNTSYATDLKHKIVTEHLFNGKTALELMTEYQLPSRALITSWVHQYNKDKTTGEKPSRKRDRNLARKTTKSERLKIAQQVIDGVYGYQEAANAYDVTYQMVYGWVRKLKAGGPEALEDRRGKAKEISEQTAEDKLMQENRELKKRVRELEVAEALLKKLKEIQRRENH